MRHNLSFYFVRLPCNGASHGSIFSKGQDERVLYVCLFVCVRVCVSECVCVVKNSPTERIQ